jgi:patatin-like phospholipase/acyl hydrolase
MKAKIFISYRRNDCRWQSKAIFDDLTNYFGEGTVFKDLEIIPGLDFEKQLQEELEEANIVLLLISKNWIKELKKRLNNEKDYVLYEISTAIALGKYIIPLLFDEAKIPSEKDLPSSVSSVAKMNGIIFPEAYFASGIQKLRLTINNYLKQSSSPKRVLALDNSGMRTAALLGILQHVEQQLRYLHDRDTLHLYNYFDMICGCGDSTLIATLIAQGRPVKEVFQIYRRLIDVLNKSKYQFYNFFDKFKATYSEKRLDNFLIEYFGESTLQDNSLVTGLWSVLYDVAQRKPVRISNIPSLNNNIDDELFKIRNLIRASFAMPSYIKPLHTSKSTYIEGAIYCGRNPSLSFFQCVQVNNQQEDWKTGTENLYIFSLGAEMHSHSKAFSKQQIANFNILDWASNLPDILLNSIDRNTNIVLQASSTGQSDDELLESHFISDEHHKTQKWLLYNRFVAKYEQGIVTPENYDPSNIDAWFDLGLRQARIRLGADFFPQWFMV